MSSLSHDDAGLFQTLAIRLPAAVRVKAEAWMNFLFLVYSYTKLPG
jgi:hypothetical protein